MKSQTMTQLRQLKLGGMANALQTQLEQVGTYEGLAFIERLSLLLEQENLPVSNANKNALSDRPTSNSSRAYRKSTTSIRAISPRRRLLDWLRLTGSIVLRTCW